MSKFFVACCSHTALLAFLVTSVAAAETQVLIPKATEGGATWRYTTDDPGENWATSDYDDSGWARGKAGFGVTDHVTPPTTIGTAWTREARAASSAWCGASSF